MVWRKMLRGSQCYWILRRYTFFNWTDCIMLLANDNKWCPFSFSFFLVKEICCNVCESFRLSTYKNFGFNCSKLVIGSRFSLPLQRSKVETQRCLWVGKDTLALSSHPLYSAEEFSTLWNLLRCILVSILISYEVDLVLFFLQPRRGCFEIREEGGETFIGLLVKLPWRVSNF